MPSRPSIHQPVRIQGSATHRDASQARAIDIRNSIEWQRCREAYAKAHPLCRDPYGQHARDGQAVVGTQIHHVRPLIRCPEMALDFRNLANLCGRCHADVEATERHGVTTYHLFENNC